MKKIHGEDVFEFLYKKPPKSKEDWLEVHHLDREISCVPSELMAEDGCEGVMGWLQMLEVQNSMVHTPNKVWFGEYPVGKKYLQKYDPAVGKCRVKLKYALEIAGDLVKK